jgi:two-component system sensor histidine kinase YesM
MKKKLFINNFLLYIAILLVPIIILGSSIFIIASNYSKNTIQTRNELLVNTGIEKMESSMKQMEAITINLSVRSSISRKVASAFNHPYGGIPSSDYYLVNTVVNMLLSVSSSNEFIYSIYLYVPNDYQLFIDSNSGISEIPHHIDNAWYESASRKEPGQITWFEKRDVFRYSFETEPIPVLSIYRRIASPLLPGGVLVLNIHTDRINSVFEQVANAAEIDFFLMNNDGTVLFSNTGVSDYSTDFIKSILENPQSDFTSSINGKKIIVSKQYSQVHPEWIYVSVMDKSLISKLPHTVSDITVVLVVGCFLMSAFLAYRVTRKNISYLNDILSIIEHADKGNQLPDISRESSDVYGYILKNIVRTFANNQLLSAQLAEKNYKIQVLEFMALRSQIQPHFLYNTLETINWITIGLTKGPNIASVMIENLSRILSYSFNNSTEHVEIRNEIDIINCYFNIQKIRYKQLSDVIWSVDKALLDHKILKFMIQPIVENCFQHGLYPKCNNFSIKISIFARDNLLYIQVIDNGKGMSYEKLKKLRRQIEKKELSKGDHIGLTNSNQRIKLYYGDEYGIKVSSWSNIGTAVRIILPLSYDEVNDKTYDLEENIF